MQADKRQILLRNFFRLFDIDKVELTKVDIDKILGTAIYNDNEEQDFCWHMTEENIPFDDLNFLIKIIVDNKLNRNDKIIANETEIFIKSGWTERSKFDKVYNQLFDIEIKMVDNGKESDSFFMHD